MLVLDHHTFTTLSPANLGNTDAARAGLPGTRLFTADEAGVLVDSTVVVGETSAMVVDTQFTRASAVALADLITATGRRLDTIFVTHHHPDHLFGLSILLDRFPEARAIAHPAVLRAMESAAKPTFDRMIGSVPRGVFPEKLALPEAMRGNYFTFEGERVDVLDPMRGDTALITPVHIKALDTLIVADIAYTDTHLWLEENTKPEQIDAWRASIAAIEAVGASTIIPGHRKPESVSDRSVLDFTRNYLARWEKAIGSSRSAEELKQALVTGQESLGFGFALSRSVASIYPTGEAHH